MYQLYPSYLARCAIALKLLQPGSNGFSVVFVVLPRDGNDTSNSPLAVSIMPMNGMALFFKPCKGTNNSFHSLCKTLIILEPHESFRVSRFWSMSVRFDVSIHRVMVHTSFASSRRLACQNCQGIRVDGKIVQCGVCSQIQRKKRERESKHQTAAIQQQRIGFDRD